MTSFYVNTKFNSSPPEHAPLVCPAGTGHTSIRFFHPNFLLFSFLLCFRPRLSIKRLRHRTPQWSPGTSTTGVTTSRERPSSQHKRCGCLGGQNTALNYGSVLIFHTFKQLRRRREEQQVEIRRQKVSLQIISPQSTLHFFHAQSKLSSSWVLHQSGQHGIFCMLTSVLCYCSEKKTLPSDETFNLSLPTKASNPTMRLPWILQPLVMSFLECFKLFTARMPMPSWMLP